MWVLFLFLDWNCFNFNMSSKIGNVEFKDEVKEKFDSCVYVLKCFKDEEKKDFLYYTDIAQDPIKKINTHFKEQHRYTKRFKGNMEIGYVELYKSLEKAQKRKEQIKKLRRNDKKKLVSKKVTTLCDKCHSEMKRKIFIDLEGNREVILECESCKYWEPSPVKL
ncbi:MAG: hypothetical protein BAJALOKI2v1_320009 [Promethearchaeota archaeon]|nr:MAG: hypothetical protein BAJALOKI2v1_320009 [Candidatus Lokiarchaeota archaeon]